MIAPFYAWLLIPAEFGGKQPRWAELWATKPDPQAPYYKTFLKMMARRFEDSSELLASLPCCTDDIEQNAVRLHGCLSEIVSSWYEYCALLLSHPQGERQLLLALQRLALNRANGMAARTTAHTARPAWRSLATANSVEEFLRGLLALYSYSTCNPKEIVWATCQKGAADGLHLLHILQGSVASEDPSWVQRARDTIIRFLAGRGERELVQSLSMCQGGVKEMERILSGARNATSLVRAAGGHALIQAATRVHPSRTPSAALAALSEVDSESNYFAIMLQEEQFFDLALVYWFLGTHVPAFRALLHAEVPPETHADQWIGYKCAVCDTVGLTFQEWSPDEQMPKASCAYHNPWRCRKVTALTKTLATDLPKITEICSTHTKPNAVRMARETASARAGGAPSPPAA